MNSTVDESHVFNVQSIEDLPSLVLSAWRSAVETLQLNPTLHPGWLEVARRTIGAQQPLSVFVWSQQQNIRGVLPYIAAPSRVAGIPMKVVSPASDLFCYHAVVVSADPVNCIERLLGHLPGWDVLHAYNVDVDGRFFKALRELATRRGAQVHVVQSEKSPYLKIDTEWERLLASKHKKFRYGVRHRRDLVAKENGRLVWFEGDADHRRLLDDIVAIDKDSWKAEIGKDIAASKVEHTYHAELLRYLACSGSLLANVLYFDDQPVAYCLCCHVNGWVGNLKTSFIERHAAISPGAFVVDAAVQRAFELGAREFDFLGDVGRHKLAWTSTLRPQAEVYIYAPTIKGRFAHLLKTIKARWKDRRGKKKDASPPPGERS